MSPPPSLKGSLRSVPAPVHPLAGKTLREQIAAGRYFGQDGIEEGICAVCRGTTTEIDTHSGLDRQCFRSWRWGNGAEYVLKGT